MTFQFSYFFLNHLSDYLKILIYFSFPKCHFCFKLFNFAFHFIYITVKLLKNRCVYIEKLR